MKTITETTNKFKGKLLELDVSKVQLSNSSVETREIVKHPEVVCVWLYDKNNNAVLVKQYRAPINDTIIEMIAGKLEDGEEPEAAARRETLEETGYNISNITFVGASYPTVGYSTEKQYYFIAASDSDPVAKSEEDKDNEIILVNQYEMKHLYMTKELMDGKIFTMLGMLSIATSPSDPSEEQK